MGYVNCAGHEDTFLACPHYHYSHSCRAYQGAGVICNGMRGNLDQVLFKSQQVSIKFLFQILLAMKTLMIARRTTFAETTTVMTSLVTNIQQLIVVFQVLQLSIICFCI